MANDNQEPTTVGNVAGKTAKSALFAAALTVAAGIGLAVGGVAAIASGAVLLGGLGLVAAAGIAYAGTSALVAAGAVGGGYALVKGVSKIRGENQVAAQEEERNKVFAATLQAAQVDAYNQGVNAGQGQVITKLQEIQQQAQQSAYAKSNTSNYYDESDDKSNSFAARSGAGKGSIKPESIRQQQAEAAHSSKQVG